MKREMKNVKESTLRKDQVRVIYMKESGDEMKKEALKMVQLMFNNREQWAQMGGIIGDEKAGINIQEGRQRGRRKLQRSGDVIHRQPNPRSSFDNTFEVVGRTSAATGWQPEGFQTGEINSWCNTNNGKDMVDNKKGKNSKTIDRPNR